MKDERLEEIISVMELWAEYYDKTHESTIAAQTSYNYSAELKELFTQEQSRRAVQPEEVQEVIECLEFNRPICTSFNLEKTNLAFDLAITALRYYGGIENDK